MDRTQIYQQLTDLIPEISRRECTPRVMQPVDVLLDQLVEIQLQEEFDRVFNA